MMAVTRKLLPAPVIPRAILHSRARARANDLRWALDIFHFQAPATC